MKEKIFCCLISICFLIGSVSSAAAFTIIYKDGKRIEGTWLSENQQTIRIKDKAGIVLSISKSQSDLRAMAAESRYSVKQVKGQPEKPDTFAVKEEPVKRRTIVQHTDTQPPTTRLP